MITGTQIKMARAALGWSTKDMAAKAKVSPNTIVRIEGGEAALSTTLGKIQGVLEKAGITFTPDGCVCPPGCPRKK